MAVTCVPIPPCFFGLPLRQIMLPFIGPLPVNSQNLAITISCLKSAKPTIATRSSKSFFRRGGEQKGAKTRYRDKIVEEVRARNGSSYGRQRLAPRRTRAKAFVAEVRLVAAALARAFAS